MLQALAGITQQQGAITGAFNPATDITWHSLFWTEGTDFAALSLSNGDAVTAWPDETGNASDLTVPALKTAPSYVATDTDFNDAPSVQFDIQTEALAGVFTTAATQPFTLFIVAISDESDSVNRGVYGDWDGTTLAHVFDTGAANNGQLRVRGVAGTAYTANDGLNDTDAAGSAHCHVAVINGATSKHIVDGGTPNSFDMGDTADTGPDVALGNLTPGPTHWMRVVMAAHYDGDLTGDAAWGDLKTWLADHYGLTIA